MNIIYEKVNFSTMMNAATGQQILTTAWKRYTNWCDYIYWARCGMDNTLDFL